jgi:hypothetical protein
LNLAKQSEKKPNPTNTKLEEPAQVISDSSNEDIKPKAEKSSPASRRMGSSPAPRRVGSSPSKPAKREASSPVEIDLVSSDSDDEVVVDEGRKRRKVEGGSSPSSKPFVSGVILFWEGECD